ncbi:MAG: ABC-F family ATP-binding cassette domain-containing protein [Vicinamibacteria bacterium]|nr:ABC-F family ATP-binding cassette domain-containing protein [Vicinamibacteria bacterium]
MPELLLSCQDLAKAHGATPLFEGLSLGIFEGDHIGLVGPNGSGKSTLLRILAGLEEPGSGNRAARKRLRIGFVEQDPTFAPGSRVGSVLRDALENQPGLDPHEKDARVAQAMGQAGFTDPGAETSALSGGWRKRLAIARELVQGPELLLLDEPTNHLDLDGILWLEELLPREPEAFVAVSHDRYFLEAVAGRVIELNRAFAAGLFDVKGRYSRFLEKKDEALAGQAAYQESLRNRVRGELDWLSRKARARTRKAQARIDEAGRLQGELADLDDRSKGAGGGVAIDFAATERRTKRLLWAEGLEKAYGPRKLLDGLDLTLGPGMRLGLLGANGSGKSTLLRLLAGHEAPDVGTVARAPNLRVVVFDQHRSRLDPELSLERTLAPSGDSVIFQGRSIHVAGWAKRFLFRSEQLVQPVGRLSGGEQARVLIAQLMLEPADVLMLDEPTNDLDIPTLEVLEESLLEFPGALVLVTHDRYLLDRVSNKLLALDGQGGAVYYADYAQWEAGQEARRQAEKQRERPAPRATGTAAATVTTAAPAADKPRKLSYHEQREMEGMEARILDAELKLEAARAAAEDPAIASDPRALTSTHEALAAAQQGVDTLYARWAELEAKRG